MLDPKIQEKMKKYNELQSQADNLRHEVETYLDNQFCINETDSCMSDDGLTQPFSIDGNCPVYEWGTRYFDIDMIKKIIQFIEEYQSKVGEHPDIDEINKHFA